jgi:hypothetical protein
MVSSDSVPNNSTSQMLWLMATDMALRNTMASTEKNKESGLDKGFLSFNEA